MRLQIFALVLVLALSISPSARQTQSPAPAAKGQRLETLTWREAEPVLTPETVVVHPARRGQQGARAAPEAAQRPDARRLPDPARRRRGGRRRRAHAHVSLLSGVPRVSRIHVARARHGAGHDRRCRAHAVGVRPSPLLRAQYRRVDRAGPRAGRGTPRGRRRAHALHQPQQPARSCDQGLHRAGGRHARRRGRDLDDALHRSVERRHDARPSRTTPHRLAAAGSPASAAAPAPTRRLAPGAIRRARRARRDGCSSRRSSPVFWKISPP